MILPKELFEKIEYFEHTFDHKYGTHVDDVFTLHFKAWWRRKRVIRIKRLIEDYNEADGTFAHHPTPGAGDLYNQLNNWSTDTFEQKLDSMKHKYETNETNNVIQLKQRPKDISDE